MRLYELYRPRRLADVVGQPPVAFLKALAARPYPCCILLHGPPGCGKTAAAYALAAELGCVDEYSGLETVVASDLTIDRVRDLFGATLRMPPFENPRGWHVLVVEELETVSKIVDTKLKVDLETQLPAKAIVVTTSNDTSKLSKALKQRFKTYEFKAGPEFAVAAQKRLEGIWRKEAPGFPMPTDYRVWGWENGVYSLRVALDVMQDHLTVLFPCLAEAA